MIMVVALHYFGRGGLNLTSNALPLNSALGETICIFCRVAVNCFFMINGYFIVVSDSKVNYKKNMRRVIDLWIKVFCYSVGITIIAIIVGAINFNWKILIRAMLPIISNQYWFITIFILVLSVRPFISKMLYLLTEKEIGIMVGILLFFDSFIAVIGDNGYSEFGNGILHALTMVLLGYAVKIIGNRLFAKNAWGVLVYLLSSFTTVLLVLIFGKILHMDTSRILIYNSPLIVLASLGLFVFFENISIKGHFFSAVSSNVLAIYLINDHPIMRELFYEKVLHCSNWYDSKFMMLHFILCVLGYVIGALIIDRALMTALRVIQKCILKNTREFGNKHE